MSKIERAMDVLEAEKDENGDNNKCSHTFYTHQNMLHFSKKFLSPP